MPLTKPARIFPTFFTTSTAISGRSSTTLFIVSPERSNSPLMKSLGSSPNASSIWSMDPTMPPTLPPSSPSDLPIPSEPFDSEVMSFVMPFAKPYSDPFDISLR